MLEICRITLRLLTARPGPDSLGLKLRPRSNTAHDDAKLCVNSHPIAVRLLYGAARSTSSRSTSGSVASSAGASDSSADRRCTTTRCSSTSCRRSDRLRLFVECRMETLFAVLGASPPGVGRLRSRSRFNNSFDREPASRPRRAFRESLRDGSQELCDRRFPGLLPDGGRWG